MILREIVEHGNSQNPLNTSLDSSCKYTKQIQELLIIIKQTCPRFNNSSEKLVAVTPKNKDKRVRFTEPVTSSRNTNTKTSPSSNLDSNKPMLSSTGVKPSTSASGSQPSGNTKKDKIRQTPRSTQKNTVESHPRKVKSSLKNKDCVVEPKGTSPVQHSKLNVNSELKCRKISDDVEELYRLVKERYKASRPEGYDLMLWGDLHTIFEPNADDELWKNLHQYNLISWSLYDFCGIHMLLMDNGLAIHMLTEKKYPLSQEMLSKMLSRRLEVDHESSQAFELLRFIRAQGRIVRNKSSYDLILPTVLKELVLPAQRFDQGVGSTSGIRACALRYFDLGKMELENSQNNSLAKLPILKLGEYEMWEIRIKQYFQIQDYALWEVIENGNSWVPIPVTAPDSGPSTACKHLLMENDLLVLNDALWCFPFSHADQVLSLEKVKEGRPATMFCLASLFMFLKLRITAVLIEVNADHINTAKPKVSTAKPRVSTARVTDIQEKGKNQSKNDKTKHENGKTLIGSHEADECRQNNPAEQVYLSGGDIYDDPSLLRFYQNDDTSTMGEQKLKKRRGWSEWVVELVLEMDEDELVPIILGRPFLATARAVIDVHERKLSLRVGKQWVDKVNHDGKWTTRRKKEEDSNKVQAVSFYPRTESVEPLEWKAPENQLKPSSIEPPKLELKELPEHLEYAFLQESNQLPVVISSALSTVEKARLLEVLKNHKGAIVWSIADIKGIDSSFCTHKILMEDEFKPSDPTQ
ncbi:hypothetical protein Tco_0711610 [Tanacetum coccineum]